MPTPRQAAWWLLRPDEGEAQERAFMEALYEQAPEVKPTAAAAREFLRLVRERDGEAWPAWRESALRTLLAFFVRHLDRDQAAVQAALAHFSHKQATAEWCE